MKFFKLTRSMQYVLYPIYQEVKELRLTLRKSFGSYFDAIISASVTLIFDSNYFSDFLKMHANQDHASQWIKRLADWKFTDVVFSLFLFGAVFLLLQVVRGMVSLLRFYKNKNTKEKRDDLVYKFHNFLIPRLIEVKSMVEQLEEKKNGKTNSQTLLALQAKYNLEELQRELNLINFEEVDATNVRTQDSSILIDRIDDSTYQLVLIEILELYNALYVELINNSMTMCEADKIYKNMLCFTSQIHSKELRTQYDKIMEEMKSRRKTVLKYS